MRTKNSPLWPLQALTQWLRVKKRANDKQPSWLSRERLRFTFVLCLIPAILHEPVLGSSAYAPFETVEKESKTGERLAKLVRQSARFGWNSLFFLYVPHMWASRAFGKKELVPSSSPVMPFYGQREMIRLPRNDWKKNLVVSFWSWNRVILKLKEVSIVF